jgi:hypothetical protein
VTGWPLVITASGRTFADAGDHAGGIDLTGASPTLLAFRASGSGAGLGAWRPGHDPCAEAWPGVPCNGGAVNGITLVSEPSLTGDIGTLSTLPQLARLDLHGTKVSGGVAQLSDLPTLTYIDVSTTDVTGEVGALSTQPQLARLAVHGTKVSGGVGALAAVSTLAYLDVSGTAVTGFPLTITDGCTFFDATHPHCGLNQRQWRALQAFKASGGAATATALASWQPGTDPCGVPKWAGVPCSGVAAPAVTQLILSDYGDGGKFEHVAGQIGTLAPLAADLRHLILGGTDATGDVAGLAPLVKLTRLILDDTEVTGQAAALAPLSRLTELQLTGTAVVGCDAFCGAGGPFQTHGGSSDNCVC